MAAQPLVHVCSPPLLCPPEGIAHGRDTLRGALSRKMAPTAMSSCSSPSPRDREVGPEPCRHQGWVLITKVAFRDHHTPSAISLTSPRSGVKQLQMKQQSPQAKICMACRHLSFTLSAGGSQIPVGICALGYSMLRHHLKVHTCAGATLLQWRGCSPLCRARSWPGCGCWGQAAAS